VEEIGEAVAKRVDGMLTTGNDSHPAPASTTVPPGPDLDAADLAEKPVERPLEKMAELLDIDDGSAGEDQDHEVGGRR
jgi:hypothetical protein